MAYTRPLPHALLLAASFTLLLAGCGQRGPLYLPEEQAEPVPAQAPAETLPETPSEIAPEAPAEPPAAETTAQ